MKTSDKIAKFEQDRKTLKEQEDAFFLKRIGHLSEVICNVMRKRGQSFTRPPKELDWAVKFRKSAQILSISSEKIELLVTDQYGKIEIITIPTRFLSYSTWQMAKYTRGAIARQRSLDLQGEVNNANRELVEARRKIAAAETQCAQIEKALKKSQEAYQKNLQYMK